MKVLQAPIFVASAAVKKFLTLYYFVRIQIAGGVPFWIGGFIQEDEGDITRGAVESRLRLDHLWFEHFLFHMLILYFKVVKLNDYNF